MLNGCQVFRAVASAKEEPERTGIREPKIVLEVIAELVQGTAVTSFLLQKTKEFERAGIQEPKNQNSIPRNLNFWRARGMCPLFQFHRQIKTARYYTIFQEPKNQRI